MREEGHRVEFAKLKCAKRIQGGALVPSAVPGVSPGTLCGDETQVVRNSPLVLETTPRRCRRPAVGRDARRSTRDACSTLERLRRSDRWSRGPVFVLIALTVATAHAFQQEPPIQTDPQSGVEIRVGLPFRAQPSSGFIPVHLQISNDSGSAYAWDLSLSSNNTTPAITSGARVAVGPHQSREFDLLLPWADLNSVQPGYHAIAGLISGPGVVIGHFQLDTRYAPGNGAATVGIAEPLGSSVWGALETRLKDAGAPVTPVQSTLAAARFARVSRAGPRVLDGSPFRVDEMPADARALSGFAALWIGEAEWRGTVGPRRAAIRQWVMEGGRLFLAGDSVSPGPGLPAVTGETVSLGFGEIRRVNLGGSTLPIEETATRILDLDSTPLPPWDQDFQDSWPLRTAVGEPQPNVLLLILFVCAFGVLVGPLNLLWLAPASRRHRLFFTVPLISVSASLLLLGLIAFGDGLGGDGARNVLMLVPAGENRVTLFQEQMVRTRLLFQRSFELPETVAASFLGQPENGATGGPYGRRNRGNLTLGRAGSRLSGDWFRTRSVQGLFLRSSIPSRGEVVLRPGTAPELLSTLASSLRHVHYIDKEGRYWIVEEVATGRPARLKPGTAEEYESWSAEAAVPMSQSLRAQFQATLRRPGWFYSEADPTAENTIATLRSLRWKQQRIVCLGPTTGDATP